MKPLIRAVAYFRKSNDDKGELGESINQQREWAEEAAAREGVVIVKEFSDQSISGLETARRSGFIDMLTFCKEQDRLGTPIEAVVCYHANRFSRSDSLKTARYLDEFRDAGVDQMLTAGKWVDFNRTEDRMIFGLEQEASSHRFSVDLGKVTRRGKRAAAAKGQWCGGKPPFGYVVQGRKLALHPDEAEVVRLIFSEYESGTKTRGLAKLLSDRGIKSPKGKPAWCSQSIYRIIENPTYTGDMVLGRRTASQFLGSVTVRAKSKGKERKQPKEDWVRVADAHPALVTRETFDRVQVRRAENQTDTSPAKGKPFVLTGLVRCGHCSAPMIGRTSKGADKKSGRAYPNRYYTCSNYNTYGTLSGCNLNAVKEGDLLRVVVAKLTSAFTDPATVERVRADIRAKELAKVDSQTGRQIEARLVDLNRKVKVGTERYLSAPDDLIETCRDQLTEWKTERDRLAAELTTAKAKTVTVEGLDARVDAAVAKMQRLQEVFQKGTPATVRVLLREVIERIELHFNHKKAKERVFTTFARGLVFVHPDCLISPDSTTTGARGSRTATRRSSPN